MENKKENLTQKVKRLAVIAMVADDDLMETLIFKGGSAIQMIYKLSNRSSIDLDFSMADGFSEKEMQEVHSKIEKSLKDVFLGEGLLAFDVKFVQKPEKMSPDLQGWWGGYKVEFKLIQEEKTEEYGNDLEIIRRNSLKIGAKASTIFKIDISPYEYVEESDYVEFEDYTLKVYTPEMIVFEKLRAICQQIPEYQKTINRSTQRARARDFYDIHLLMDQFDIDPHSENSKKLIRSIFQAKKVPLHYIKEIKHQREYHRENFTSVKDTVEGEIENFDYYFDYALRKFGEIEF